ncbi:MAG: dihydrolipoamide acetyltransferase family protein [Bdellovibrionales bacterium]|nr:dihydrolipoamide acetyltransferase family protein [Bdellovibrionales bacterium]
MKLTVVMPELGEGVVEGELQKWCVKEGDSIKEDDIIAEITTDKASVEVPSTVSGQVKELKFKVGETCPVGTALLVVEGEQKETKKDSTPVSTGVFTKTETKVTEEPKSNQNSDHILATPLVRKLAQKHSIDLNQIKGTGLSGRITLDDLSLPKETSSGPTTPIPSIQNIEPMGPEERKPLQGVRKKIAEKMALSKQVIPHFTVMESASVEELIQLRKKAKEIYPDVKITYLSFIMKILHKCLLEFPEFNASITSNEIIYKKYFHFGFATDTPRGLLVPVVRDVDKKSIVQISRDIKELSDKARNAAITVDEMKGATITITNMGSIAGEWATPIINPPEVCILGMYRMFDRPVWKNNAFYPEKTMNFSITSDHRLIDGAVAARFIMQFVERVSNPSLILIES